jgi:hypothetical protein
MTHVTTDEEDGPIARAACMLGARPAATVLDPSQLAAAGPAPGAAGPPPPPDPPPPPPCRPAGVEPVGSMSGCETHAPGTALVFLNGNILGLHRRPQAFVATFRCAPGQPPGSPAAAPAPAGLCCDCVRGWPGVLGPRRFRRCSPAYRLCEAQGRGRHLQPQPTPCPRPSRVGSADHAAWPPLNFPPFTPPRRELRRRGLLHEFVHVHLQNDACYISCDGGRVCRPLIICDRCAFCPPA